MMTSKGGPGRSEEHTQLIQSWRHLADQLGPLIGDSGFCALYGRACRLVGPEFKWLAETPPCKTRDSQITALDELLASVAPDHAQAAHAALLKTFTELLASLIGQALARRLLDAAARDGEEKNAQEHK
ncbi:hypothetical protein [Massilia arenae]|uniref:Uncharacterized protein n=1 Tax=Massilia arenae TaxID=2603288 RepID=A0A5C7FRQ4_9BURK|nr:hypothetical protein [Massilia arenae]TXF98538.1 hypothetical protein FVD38_16535 [Massilia arenae]